MPTRNAIRDATPRCPGTKVGTSNYKECGRLLTWIWICEKHGVQNHATQHDRAAA